MQEATPESPDTPQVVSKGAYEKELERLQTELVRMQEWIVHEGLQVMVIFEGRDTAGKGGTIKRIIERLNARHCPGGRARARPPSGNERSGTSSATSRTSRRRARSCCSTAVGTTAPASSA